MSVRRADIQDHQKWDDYVYTTHAPFQLLFDWGEVYRLTFGCKIIRLISESSGNVNGVLSIFIVSSILGEGFSSSFPGGPYADTDEIEKELVNAAIRVSTENHCAYLKFRDLTVPIPDRRMINHIEYSSIIDTLNEGEDSIWSKIDCRRNIRKARTAGLLANWDLSLLPDFYRVYVENMRDLGTPAIPYTYFQKSIEKFPDHTLLLTVSLQGKVIGGMFFESWFDTLKYVLGSSLRGYFNYRPNDLLYWEAIVFACRNHYRVLDLGSSEENSGNAKFKEKFLAKPTELYYQYYLSTSKKIPESRGGKIYPYFRQVWRRLPLCIANAVSPIIRHYMPLG